MSIRRISFGLAMLLAGCAVAACTGGDDSASDPELTDAVQVIEWGSGGSLEDTRAEYPVVASVWATRPGVAITRIELAEGSTSNVRYNGAFLTPGNVSSMLGPRSGSDWYANAEPLGDGRSLQEVPFDESGAMTPWAVDIYLDLTFLGEEAALAAPAILTFEIDGREFDYVLSEPSYLLCTTHWADRTLCEETLTAEVGS